MIGLRKLFRFCANHPAPPDFTAPLCPDTPFVAVGDVHGRLDLLDQLLERIEPHLTPDMSLIFVGDYIDRGEDSAGVLARLFDLSHAQNGRVTCLRGNHEDMLLSFLDGPEEQGARWLRYGGMQTLGSYKIPGVTPTRDPEKLRHWRDQLRDKMPAEMIRWLRGLPTVCSTGNVHVVHAAADPSKPMCQQSDRVLMWGLRDRAPMIRTDGQWIVRGHVSVPDLQVENGLISVDTGACVTGKLTAALISEKGVTAI